MFIRTSIFPASLIISVNADFTAGNCRADGAGLALPVRGDRNERRAFRDAVAFVDGNTERFEGFDHFGIQRRAAADDLLKSAAEGIEHLCKEIASLIDADVMKSSCRGDTDLELLVSSGLLCLCPYLLIEGVNVKRNENESRRLKELKIFKNSCNRIVYTDVMIRDEDDMVYAKGTYTFARIVLKNNSSIATCSGLYLSIKVIGTPIIPS